MIYRKGDTERSPEGRTDGQEGINSPINPDTGQKKEQSLPMSGGDGDREEQFASMSGEMGGSAEQSPADAPLVNEGKDASGEGKGKKGEGNLILRLLNSEGMRYLFIGGCTTMVNLGVYSVCLYNKQADCISLALQQSFRAGCGMRPFYRGKARDHGHRGRRSICPV